MQYKRLGNTGLKVSELCLGCMSFGTPQRGDHAWTLPEEASLPIIRQALEAGINFLDTANAYSDGSSEEIVGRAIQQFARREEIVLATKGFFGTGKDPNGRGLSRKSLFWQLDASLKRLGTDYVDLYQIHRWDHHTPIEETLEALHDLVKSGKVRYLGASSMWAWQFAQTLYTARAHHWTPFVSMQNHYNLLYREEEREMLPLCADQGIGVIPWSPLARGRLTRDWDEPTARSKTDIFGSGLYVADVESDRRVVQAVASVATSRSVPRAQVALAWLVQKPIVTAPIIGASKPHHLTDAVAALTLKLTPEEIAQLESSYVPHPVAGHS